MAQLYFNVVAPRPPVLGVRAGVDLRGRVSRDEYYVVPVEVSAPGPPLSCNVTRDLAQHYAGTLGLTLGVDLFYDDLKWRGKARRAGHVMFAELPPARSIAADGNQAAVLNLRFEGRFHTGRDAREYERARKLAHAFYRALVTDPAGGADIPSNPCDV